MAGNFQSIGSTDIYAWSGSIGLSFSEVRIVLQYVSECSTFWNGFFILALLSYSMSWRAYIPADEPRKKENLCNIESRIAFVSNRNSNIVVWRYVQQMKSLYLLDLLPSIWCGWKSKGNVIGNAIYTHNQYTNQLTKRGFPERRL